MRSTSERTAAIQARTGELRKKKSDRRGALAVWLSAAAALALIAGLGFAMPSLMTRQSAAPGGYSGAAASVFAASGAVGYVLIGLLAFALGCCVTILCFRLRRRNREERDDRDRR